MRRARTGSPCFHVCGGGLPSISALCACQYPLHKVETQGGATKSGQDCIKYLLQGVICNRRGTGVADGCTYDCACTGTPRPHRVTPLPPRFTEMVTFVGARLCFSRSLVTRSQSSSLNFLSHASTASSVSRASR